MFPKILEKKILGNFEIDKEFLEQFCKKNAQLWKKEGQSDQYIYIGLFMVEKWIPWLERKLLYAKGLEEKTGAVPIVIDWGYNEELEKFYASYGIGCVSMKKEMFTNFTGCMYGLCKAIFFFLFEGTGEKMVHKKYKGVSIGHFVYDTIIRTNQDIYTVRKARNGVCFKKIWTTYWFLNSLKRVCKKYPPIHYIFDDLVYDEGMIAEYMRSLGSEISNFDLDNRRLHPDYTKEIIFWPDLYKHMMKQEIGQMEETQKQENIAHAQAMLEERFLGKNGNIRDSKAAFTGKKEGSREELIACMGLDPNKKNVVFCCHTLSESAHRCSSQAYEDTYTWMEETMKYVRDKDSANWIIKVHPIAAKKYGEGGVLEGLYEKYKSENLYWFPDEYNSSLVGQLADVVVTIYGHVGSEYSCLGIPVILSGNAEYAEFGYTTDAFTKEAYEKALDQAHTLERLTEEQRKTAELVFSCQNSRKQKTSDSFNEKMTELNWKFDEVTLAGKTVKDLNTETLKWVEQYCEENDIRKSDYYTAGSGK